MTCVVHTSLHHIQLTARLSVLDFVKFPSIYGQHNTFTLCREVFFSVSNAYLLSCLCGFGLWKTLKDISNFSANHKSRVAKAKIDGFNLTESSNHKKLWWLWVMSLNDGKLIFETCHQLWHYVGAYTYIGLHEKLNDLLKTNKNVSVWYMQLLVTSAPYDSAKPTISWRSWLNRNLLRCSLFLTFPDR